MKIKLNLPTIFGKILQYKISWKFIQCFSYFYRDTHASSYLNRFFTEIKTCLKMSDKLRNKYNCNQSSLWKISVTKNIPHYMATHTMCVLKSLMSLEKWILLLTLVSYTTPQILYNFRYIQNHEKHLLPSSCSSSHSAVHMCICISSVPTGQTSVKFNTGDFDENLSRKSKFG
jgi:hypothetical protein